MKAMNFLVLLTAFAVLLGCGPDVDARSTAQTIDVKRIGSAEVIATFNVEFGRKCDGGDSCPVGTYEYVLRGVTRYFGDMPAQVRIISRETLCIGCEYISALRVFPDGKIGFVIPPIKVTVDASTGERQVVLLNVSPVVRIDQTKEKIFIICESKPNCTDTSFYRYVPETVFIRELMDLKKYFDARNLP